MSSAFLWCYSFLLYNMVLPSVVWPFNWKLESSTFLWCCIWCSKAVNVWVCGWNPNVRVALSNTFLWYCLLCQGWKLNFHSTRHRASDFQNCSKKSTICTRPRYFDTHLGEWVSANSHPCYAIQGASNIWVCGWNPKWHNINTMSQELNLEK